MENDHNCNSHIFDREGGLGLFAKEAYRSYREMKQEDLGVFYHRFGDMNCVCRYIHSNGLDIDAFSFDSKDSTKYCRIWWQRARLYSLSTIAIAAFLGILNSLVSFTFNKMIKAQRKKLKAEESTSIFTTIVFLEILNNGFVFYLVSCLSLIFEKAAPSIQEKYLSHTQNLFIDQWYSKYSALIFWTLFLQAFPSNIIKLASNTMLSLSRYCCDRRCKCSRKLRIDSDGARTRLTDQDDLNKLYCGYDFPIEQAYARMTSILFTIIVFSG